MRDIIIIGGPNGAGKTSAAEELVPRQLKIREFVNADEMSKSLAASGKIALYGIYFDTDKDAIRPDSAPTLQEIAKLLNADPKLKLRVVGHTDNQGKPEYNLDLSRRRAALVSSTSRGTGVVFPFVFMALGWHAVGFASVCRRRPQMTTRCGYETTRLS